MKSKPVTQFHIVVLLTFATVSNCYAFRINLEIWEQDDQYVKLVAWDETRSARNDHPVEIETIQLSVTLRYLKAKIEGSKKIRRIFSKSQAKQLASHIQEGLDKANRKLDLVFVINDALAKGRFITGRVFYVDGRLNLIFGERSGKPGLRSRPASDALQIVEQSGIKYRGDRKDWLTLNYEQIANNIKIEELKAAASDNTPSRDKSSKDIPSRKETEIVQKPTSEEVRQAKELRLENARLKKELREQQKSKKTQKLTIEERLVRLKNLYDKELISEGEYNAKRKSILNEL